MNYKMNVGYVMGQFLVQVWGCSVSKA